MHLSNTAEYALRAVVWLADHREVPHTSSQIAEATLMPSSYLAKILQGLSSSGIVNGQRGVKGGFTLAKDPDTLTVLDVVNAVDPVQRIKDCPLGIENHGKILCNLHRILDDVMTHVEDTFSQHTIGGLLQLPNNSKPLCGLTQAGKKIQLSSVTKKKRKPKKHA